ncbi:hypothetical protein COO60DRAFT_1624502 [Scenedesmus sp. NREL 46B-D3]|nr:hypothetical protein COO60DRAFT_1624502 [Scenedesmus sp. NREL 46B-D3]
MAAIATASISDAQVRMFLHTLLGGSTSIVAGAQDPDQAPAGAPAEATASHQQPAAASPWLSSAPKPAATAALPDGSFAAGSDSAAAAYVPLRPHMRIDAVHPLGEAHSSEELENALKLYRQIVEDVHLEVSEVLIGPDKALVTGHQVVSSRVAHALAAAAQRVMGLLPPNVSHTAGELLPSFKEARVPTTIQLRFGKSDAGDPVVTQMAITFNLLSALLPHLALHPWQQHALQQLQQPLLGALVSAGSLAAVVEDVGTSLGASWRAGAAVLQATVGKVFAEVRGRMAHQTESAAAAAVETVAGGDVNGAQGAAAEL